METVNLCCPSCKAHLTLPADKANNEKLLLVCPKCKFNGNLSLYSKLKTPQVPSQHNPNNQVVDPTIIVGHNIQAALTIGRLKEVKLLNIFQLQQGMNLFGRKAANSICEHQFSNNDAFISRKHFEVNVIFNKVTLVYDHRFQDHGSRNGTKINGLKLAKGDIVLLKAGDRVLAGKTEMIFEFPLSSDDTILA